MSIVGTSQRRLAATLPATLTCALLAACSATSPSEAGAEDLARAEAVWSLPSDKLHPRNLTIGDYAENKLQQACMQARSFNWPVPEDGDAPAGSPTANAQGRRLFHEQVARQYGYRFFLTIPSGDGAADRLNTRTLTAPEEKASKICLAEARKRLPRPETTLEVYKLEQEAHYAARKDESVLEGTSTWRRCLRDQHGNVTDLPSWPPDMPGLALRAKFGLDQPEASPRPSQAELRLAVADARCRASSGFTTALFRAERLQLERILTREKDDVQRIAAQVDAYEARLKVVLAEVRNNA